MEVGVSAAAATMPLGLLMLFVYVAQADATVSCRYVAAASRAATCGREVAAAILLLSLPLPPSLGCRCYSYPGLLFSLLRFCFLPHCLPSPLPLLFSEALSAGFSLLLTQTHRNHEEKEVRFF